MTEPEPAEDAAAGALAPDGPAGQLVEAVEKDAGDASGMPLGSPMGSSSNVGGVPAGDLATLPAPAVVPAEPEPVSKIASPDELKSKAESEVIALLGKPVTTRSEGTGTVWTYRAGTCSLDVYFFLDVADNRRRALSYEMVPEDDLTQGCYKALKEAQHVQ
ncbi:MAG: hypothetical protein IPK59_18240 [Rhodospirillaceae bacterium]|nr:hypothetical protein [Rhodospirillaceae bacterium]